MTPNELLERMEARANQALGDEPDPVNDHPGLHDMWISHQRQCAEELQQDARKLVSALQAVLDFLDSYQLPSKRIDPTGEWGALIEAFEQTIREAINEALGGDDERPLKVQPLTDEEVRELWIESRAGRTPEENQEDQ